MLLGGAGRSAPPEGRSGKNEAPRGVCVSEFIPGTGLADKVSPSGELGDKVFGGGWPWQSHPGGISIDPFAEAGEHLAEADLEEGVDLA